MKLPAFARLPRPFLTGGALLLGGLGVGVVLAHTAPSSKEGLACNGEYSDSLELAAAHIRQVEQAQSSYTYLVRSSAKYECPYFGSDGKLRRRRLDAVQHGTAFAYEADGGGTFLLTNEHLAEWPDVTDGGHRVDGVQDGCKRVDIKLRIVQDERDDDESVALPLSTVATDPVLDAAVLHANKALTVLPYRIGRSAGLRQGNAVQVRGFPLGLIQAVNTGKVVNTYDRDQEQGWDHVDFVIDALLSEGNSGSPVLALSCRRGELELVGMYHAGYKGHSALNVVIGIEQLRDFMMKKRRTPHVVVDPNGSTFGPVAQTRVREQLTAGTTPLVSFADLWVAFESTADGFRYHIYGRRFPLDDRRLFVIEDHVAADATPQVTRIWVGGATGALVAWAPKALGQDEQDLLGRLAETLRTQIVRTLDHRVALLAGERSDARRHARDLERALERAGTQNKELAASLLDLGDRLAPRDLGAVASLHGTPDAGTAMPPPAPTLRASPVEP